MPTIDRREDRRRKKVKRRTVIRRIRSWIRNRVPAGNESIGTEIAKKTCRGSPCGKSGTIEQRPEWMQADPLGRRKPVPSRERVIDDVPQRIAEEREDQQDRGKRVQRPQTVADPASPRGWAGGADDPRPRPMLKDSATLHLPRQACIAASGSHRAGERGLELLVIEQRDLDRDDAVEQRHRRVRRLVEEEADDRILPRARGGRPVQRRVAENRQRCLPAVVSVASLMKSNASAGFFAPLGITKL